MANQESTEVLSAPLVIEYPFTRTTGPVIGAFLTGLREQQVLGIRDTDGRVVCPPVEYDPQIGRTADRDGRGRAPRARSRRGPGSQRPRRPAAATAARAGARQARRCRHLDAARRRRPRPDAVATGARVRIRWADEPEGLITDIACFELTGGARQHEPRRQRPRRLDAARRTCGPSPSRPACRTSADVESRSSACGCRRRCATATPRARRRPAILRGLKEKKILGERCPVDRRRLHPAPRHVARRGPADHRAGRGRTQGHDRARSASCTSASA